MRFAPLPEELRAELARRYDERSGERRRWPSARARSARTAQDATLRRPAGELPLGARRRAALRRGARLLGEPLHAARDQLPRRARRGPEPAMGVTVQLMVDAEVSGVLFTCNPVSGDPSMVAVNASWGLGIAVVGGETTPDDYLVSKVTGEVVRQTVELEGHRVRARRRPGAARCGVEVPAERRERAVPRRGRSSPRSSRSRGASSATSAPPGRRVGDRARPVAARGAARPPGAPRDRAAEGGAEALRLGAVARDEHVRRRAGPRTTPEHAAERGRRPRDPAADRRVGRRGAPGRDRRALAPRRARRGGRAAVRGRGARTPTRRRATGDLLDDRRPDARHVLPRRGARARRRSSTWARASSRTRSSA